MRSLCVTVLVRDAANWETKHLRSFQESRRFQYLVFVSRGPLSTIDCNPANERVDCQIHQRRTTTCQFGWQKLLEMTDSGSTCLTLLVRQGHLSEHGVPSGCFHCVKQYQLVLQDVIFICADCKWDAAHACSHCAQVAVELKDRLSSRNTRHRACYRQLKMTEHRMLFWDR